MASHLTRGRPIIQDKKFNIRQKDPVADGATRSSKVASKRGGTGFGSRKALNDITNKSSIRHEVSSKKPSLPKEEFNIAEERFLHDHKKCNEAQLKGKEPCFLDIVLPGHDLVTDGATRSSKVASKRGGTGFASRKALNDITNKSSIRHEVSSKKPSLPKEEFNIAEERFLHDHKKCIEAKLKGKEPCFLDIVLPGHDDVSHKEQPKSKQAKTDHDIPRCYSEESMSEFFAELSVSTQWVSPHSSPTLSDSSPSSLFAWEAKPVEFKLKDKE